CIGKVECDDNARINCHCEASHAEAIPRRSIVRHGLATSLPLLAMTSSSRWYRLLFGPPRRVRLPRRTRGAVPVVLPRPEAAVVTLVHGETLRMLVDERLDELQIAALFQRRLEKLR